MDTMLDMENASRLLLALGIGLLVGIERGWHTRDASGGARVAGVRTYALAGVLGGVSGALVPIVGPLPLGMAFVGFTILVLYAYRATAKSEGDFGLTSEVAALVVFMLGAYAVLGDMALAAAGGVITVALLDAKRYLHKWVNDIERLELNGAIQLLVISVVILPVLPDRGFGPGDVLNPFKMWLMVVFVAALSFVGYIAIRKLGARLGTLATALFGGLASSTALTISFARLGRKSPAITNLLAAGIAVASAMMYLRVLLVVGAFKFSLVADLAWPLGLMAAASALGAAVLHLAGHGQSKQTEPDIGNPTDLSMAVQFGVLLGVVALLSHYGNQWIGSSGVYAVAAVTGLADVDAITLNMAQMAGGEIDLATAKAAIFIAVAVNTLVKFAIVWAFAGRRLGLRLAALSAGAIAAGAVGLAIDLA